MLEVYNRGVLIFSHLFIRQIKGSLPLKDILARKCMHYRPKQRTAFKFTGTESRDFLLSVFNQTISPGLLIHGLKPFNLLRIRDFLIADFRACCVNDTACMNFFC
jgi:hypothetical protein